MNRKRTFMALGMLSGGIYTVIGVIVLLNITGILPLAIISGDILTGFMILIVGLVFLEGVKTLRKSVSAALPFLMVGSLLAGIIAGLQIIILFSNGLGWLIGLEDWTNWNAVDDLTAAIWVFPAVLPLLVAMHPFSQIVVKQPEEST